MLRTRDQNLKLPADLEAPIHRYSGMDRNRPVGLSLARYPRRIAYLQSVTGMVILLAGTASSLIWTDVRQSLSNRIISRLTLFRTVERGTLKADHFVFVRST
jgi:hypothetical protein